MITPQDYDNAASDLGCELAVIKAVAKIEGGSGFQADGKLRILFESYQFYKNLKSAGLDAGKLSKTSPDLITTKWVANYGKFSEQWRKLERAVKIHHEAAYKSCSWGMFQPMGMYCKEMGFKDVFEMASTFQKGEEEHLKGFVKMIKYRGLADELQRKDWVGFAVNYNGSGYAKNRYDKKLEDAYKYFKKLTPPE